ncbi:MAG: oligosaccharide flippase family protein [Ignavibacteriae bacterium]|nr:oligosaccharide flippase family protein [Ignavibacteriota bacterium]
MIAQKLILGYSSRIVSQVLQMLGMLIVARILGPSVTGTVAFGLAFVSMFLFISDFGLSSAHIKLISEGQDESKCNGTFARLKLLLTGVYVLVVLGFYAAQKFIFGVTFESPDHDYVILIYLVLVAVNQLYFIPTTTFAAKTEQAKQDIPAFIQLFIYQVLRVIVAFLGYKAIAQSLSNLAAVILVFPIYWYLFRGYPVGQYDKKLAKLYFNISVPVFIVLIAQTVIYSTDRVILQYLTNSDEVGYYAAGFSISQFVRLIESSAGILFFPFFSKNITEGEFGKINSSIKKYERFNLSFVLPLVFYIMIFSEFVVSIALGPKFAKTPPMLAVITISMFISLINLPYINIISGKGLFKQSATVYVIGTVFFLIFSFLLVSPFLLGLKGIGIALSLLCTNIFFGVVFMIYSKKELNSIIIFQGKYLMLYGIIYSIAAYYIYNMFSLGLIGKIISSAVYFAGYFGFALLFRLITIEDWKMTLEIINVKKMYNYVNTELKIK